MVINHALCLMYEKTVAFPQNYNFWKWRKTMKTVKYAEQDQNQKYFSYLDRLRESGETNMWGAVPYLQREFPELGFDKAHAREIHSAWMKSFQGGTEQ